MTERLLAYLMDDISSEERAVIENRLAADPAWQAELARLEQCLATTCEPCACGEEPPTDLVSRTCSKIVHTCHGEATNRGIRRGEAQGTQASCNLRSAFRFSEDRSHGGGRCRWAPADVFLAGGVTLILASLIMPALRESRDASRRVYCQNNQQWLGAQLFNFQERRQHRPPTIEPNQSASMFSAMLADQGGVDARELAQHLVCPESQLADLIRARQVVVFIPSQAQWNAASPRDRARFAAAMGSYAYRFGFFDQRGEYHPVRFTGSQDSPLLADAPQVLENGVRIANHGGRGQYVLYENLAVRFRRQCVLPKSDDHMFLNAKGEHAAGNDPDDVVLGCPAFAPTGPLAPVDLQ